MNIAEKPRNILNLLSRVRRDKPISAEERELARNSRWQLDDFVRHSDTCFKEATYLLGVIQEDPHPDHKVSLDPLPKNASQEYINARERNLALLREQHPTKLGGPQQIVS